MSDIFLTIFFLFIAIVSIAIYFIPTIIASNKNHRYKTAITILNIFGGLTGILWVVALVWCFVEPEEK